LLIGAALLLAGCPGEVVPTPAAKPRTSLTLRVLVVNDAKLAEAINRLRGEWEAQGPGELKVTSTAWADIATGESIEADVVVFPSRYLGDLCSRKLLRPVRANVLESQALDVDDFFPVVKRDLMKWGGQVMALPLGVELISRNTRNKNDNALSLLKCAAPRIVSAERIGVLFDSETMKPRIADAEFVAALQELTEANGKPDAAMNKGRRESSPAVDLRPGQKHRENVPVVGYGDRLAAVTASSRNAASAFKLLEWLARADTSTQLARAGAGVLPPRESLVNSPKWYPDGMAPEERERIAEALSEAMTNDVSLVVPRIPAIDEYLAFLDRGVASATKGSVTPQQVLDDVAKQWEEITNAHGREAQRQAYLKHLGINGP
jgi:ABC-type glycerol-3-phosphate transport system substrate-binding protein